MSRYLERLSIMSRIVNLYAVNWQCGSCHTIERILSMQASSEYYMALETCSNATRMPWIVCYVFKFDSSDKANAICMSIFDCRCCVTVIGCSNRVNSRMILPKSRLLNRKSSNCSSCMPRLFISCSKSGDFRLRCTISASSNYWKICWFSVIAACFFEGSFMFWILTIYSLQKLV